MELEPNHSPLLIMLQSMIPTLLGKVIDNINSRDLTYLMMKMDGKSTNGLMLQMNTLLSG